MLVLVLEIVLRFVLTETTALKVECAEAGSHTGKETDEDTQEDIHNGTAFRKIVFYSHILTFNERVSSSVPEIYLVSLLYACDVIVRVRNWFLLPMS